MTKSQLTDLRRLVPAAFNRYRMSTAARKAAWYSATRDPAHAIECYRAIEWSLNPHNPVTPSLAEDVNAT